MSGQERMANLRARRRLEREEEEVKERGEELEERGEEEVKERGEDIKEGDEQMKKGGDGELTDSEMEEGEEEEEEEEQEERGEKEEEGEKKGVNENEREKQREEREKEGEREKEREKESEREKEREKESEREKEGEKELLERADEEIERRYEEEGRVLREEEGLGEGQPIHGGVKERGVGGGGDGDGGVEVRGVGEGGTSRTEAAPYGSMSRSSFYRARAKLQAAMADFTIMETLELVLLMAAAHSPASITTSLRPDKQLVTLSASSLKQFMSGKAGMPVMARERRMGALLAISSILREVKEPELVVEEFMVAQVLADHHSHLLLRTLGLQVSDSLVGGQLEEDRAVSREVLESMMISARKNSDRHRAIDHAVAVATRLQLQDGRGHITRLMAATR